MEARLVLMEVCRPGSEDLMLDDRMLILACNTVCFVSAYCLEVDSVLASPEVMRAARVLCTLLVCWVVKSYKDARNVG